MPAVCPYCGSKAIRRSKRRGMVESSLSLIWVRPFRCKDCDQRFYAFISPARLVEIKSAGSDYSAK